MKHTTTVDLSSIAHANAVKETARIDQLFQDILDYLGQLQNDVEGLESLEF